MNLKIYFLRITFVCTSCCSIKIEKIFQPGNMENRWMHESYTNEKYWNRYFRAYTY